MGEGKGDIVTLRGDKDGGDSEPAVGGEGRVLRSRRTRRA